MSELSDKKAAATESLRSVGRLDAPPAAKPSRRVKIWATAGGIILAFQIYVWIRWITGPYFTRVDPGPTDPPTFMKIALMMWQIGSPVLFPVAIWWFIIRPWRRERRITLDGMIMVSTGLFFFQDPLLNYINTWCTYNAWAFNMGSWAPHVPGWMSPRSPARRWQNRWASTSPDTPTECCCVRSWAAGSCARPSSAGPTLAPKA